MKIINFNKKKIKLLTKDLLYLQRKIEKKYVKDKKYDTVRDHCHYAGEYRGAVHSIRNLKQCT